MTSDVAAGVVRRWVRLYTRGLPSPAVARRVEELDVDLHDHIAHDRTRGTSERRIALAILSRMVRGVPADLSWRRHVRTEKGDLVKPFAAVLGLAIAVAFLALVLDSGPVILVSVALIVADGIGIFVVGAKAAQRGNFLVPFVATVAGAMAVAALAVGAIVVGERGDAPGLVLFGVVAISCVVVGAFSLGARTGQRTR